MRINILLALIVALLAGCSTMTNMTEEERVAWINKDPRVWPPVVVGQPFPVQMMTGKN